MAVSGSFDPIAQKLPDGFSAFGVGEGPPLVLLPGLGRKPVTRGSAHLALARVTQRRLVVLNRPVGLARGLTMRELAARHARVLLDLFGRPVDVMGVSTGGVIALQTAVDAPAVIDRLVVAAAAAWLGEDGREKLRRLGEQVALGRSGAEVLASVLAPPRWEWLARSALRVAHWPGGRSVPRDMLATIDAEVGFDVRAELGRIRAATLLIAGGRDRAFPVNLARETAAGIPECRLVVYPNAGHIGTMVNGRFGSDVAAFLNAKRT